MQKNFCMVFQLVKKVSLTFLTALQPPGILKEFQNTIIQKA